jgi:hypothetical protein
MPDTMEAILDDLEDAAHDGKVTLAEMAEAAGHRGAAPFLVVPPILEISPIGGIPGLPTFLALVIFVFAVQIALGRDEPHIPGKLGRRGVDGRRFCQAIGKVRPLARRLDGWFHGRLAPLTSRYMRRLAAAVICAMCLTVPPLELIPFASTLPMGAILILGLALLFRDGLVMLAGLVAAAGAGIGVAWFVSTRLLGGA